MRPTAFRAPIHQALTFLLEHQPPHMHLAITPRKDPPLPLARLRAQHEEQMMLDHFGEEYHAYLKQTGRIIPRLGR